jgi:hypothetical protein
MVIRDLDGEGNSLTVFRQNDGDIIVSIRHDGKSYKDTMILGVRVGSVGSGHSIPPKIFSLLDQLATEFEKYKDCRNENDAYDAYARESSKIQ